MENIQTTTSAPENATTETSAQPSTQEIGQSTQPEALAAHQIVDGNQAPPTIETAPTGDNQDDGIPQKWVGKSLDDILKANRELEKKMHQQSEEFARYRKEHEAKAPEPNPQNLSDPTPQATPPVQNVKSMEEWLGEEFNKDWAADPQTAVQRDRQRRDQWRTYQDNYSKQFEFGEAAKAGKVPGMEDFGHLLPKMTSIAKQLAPLINPVYETHPELLRAVYYIAKGMNSTEQLSKVATAKAQVSTAVMHEKLAAAAESPSASEPAPTIDPWNMKTEDLKKLLGTVDRSVEG